MEPNPASSRSLQEITELLRDLDFALLTTITDGGALASRPMSNNREVEYDGDSWFFAPEDSRMIADLAQNPHASLGYQGKSGLLGLRPLFVTVEGEAELIRDRDQFAAHWHKELERWWPEGIDTPGLVLIRVRAQRIHWWEGEEEGEVVLA